MAQSTKSDEENLVDGGTSTTATVEVVVVPKKPLNKWAWYGFICVLILIKLGASTYKATTVDNVRFQIPEMAPITPQNVNPHLLPLLTESSVDIRLAAQNYANKHYSNKNRMFSYLFQLPIIKRDEWRAQPRDKKLTEQKLPVDRVLILDTATESCDTKAQCAVQMRCIQTFDMVIKHWYDIGSNFFICGDGMIYEGRGWNFDGMPTNEYNSGSIGITFMGTFTNQPPQQLQFDALKSLLEEGVRLGKLTENYEIHTESPGDKLLEVIKDWPHYSNYVVF